MPENGRKNLIRGLNPSNIFRTQRSHRQGDTYKGIHVQ